MENNKKEKNNVVAISLITSLIGGVVGGIATFGVINKNNIQIGNTNNVKYEVKGVENAEVAIAESATPSIVGIKVTALREGFLGMLQKTEGSGSGIIYSKDGYIITNYHVVEDVAKDNNSKLEVYLAGKKEPIEAKYIGGDKLTDLAVVKVESNDLKVAKFGKSGELKVGSKAVAIGNPLGLEFAGTVTSGIVSALDREITTDGSSYKLIQTDAAINPGNSGGALLNSKGEVIGINTIKIGSSGVEGLGFAIPIDDALPIVDELIKSKKVRRPYIGITCIEVSKEDAKEFDIPEGIMIQNIEKGSSADKADLQRGDIIVEVDSKEVKVMDELNKAKNAKKIGDTLKLKVFRDEKYITINLVLQEEK